MAIYIYNEAEIARMRVACRLAAEVLEYIEPYVKPGVTTSELNELCHRYMVEVQQVIPAPLNYAPPGHKPFPAAVCTSVNHQVCHGIPSDKKLKDGDIVNLDITVIKDGFYGDTSRMFIVGKPSVQGKRLCEVTYACLWAGIRQVRPGARLGDIGHAYAAEPALFEGDCKPEGFEWVDCSDAAASVLSFLRKPLKSGSPILAVFNFTPVPRLNYRIGVPKGGIWKEILNSDAQEYGGSGLGNMGQVVALESPCHGRPFSLELTLPPLAVMFFKPQ